MASRLLPDPPFIVPTCPVPLDVGVLDLPPRPEGVGLVPPVFRELRSLTWWLDRVPFDRWDESLDRAWEAWSWWRDSPWYKVVPLIPQVPCSPNIRAVDLVGLKSGKAGDLAALLHDIHIGFAPEGWHARATNSQFLGRISQVTRAQSNAMRQAQKDLGIPVQTWHHQKSETRKKSSRGVVDLHGVFRSAKPPHEPWASKLPPDVLVSCQAPEHYPGKRGILFIDPRGEIRYWT